MSKEKIAFQGELGANSHEACCDYFPTMEPLPCATFDEAFESMKSGKARLGMIPIENSLVGRVADVHHLLPASGLRIVGERFKSIRFHIMANPGVILDDVRVIQSMPVALGQCRTTLCKLRVRTQPFGDTAGAARFLQEHPDPKRAVIASALAAELLTCSR